MDCDRRKTLFAGGIHARPNHWSAKQMILLGSCVAIVAVSIFALMAFYLYANGQE